MRHPAVSATRQARLVAISARRRKRPEALGEGRVPGEGTLHEPTA